jgi:HEAT repeat protein
MRAFSVVLVTCAVLLPLTAQDVKPKDVRDAAKSGASSIPTLQGYLKNQPPDTRAEAVKQLTEVGTAASLDPLILATQDADPQIQILATDGLVNFYSPGYVKNRPRRLDPQGRHQYQGQIHRHQRSGDRRLRDRPRRRD